MENEKAAALTVVDLNDDCLECIFKRLGLAAQLPAARACRRFHDVIARMWRRNRMYHTLCLEQWRELLTLDEDLQYFLRVMRNHFKAIRVLDCPSAFISDLTDLDVKELPNVERFEMEQYTECCPSDCEMLSLSTLVPNLKYMRITSPISGQHIAKFKKLEELHLYEDREKQFEIRNEYLQEICKELKQLRVLDVRTYEISHLKFTTNIECCTNLQVLQLNLKALKPILKQVLRLPHLKRLTVLLDQVIDVNSILNVDTHDFKIYETNEFFEIVNTQCERITGLSVDNYYLPLASRWDKQLPILRYGKLRHFAFCSCDESDPEEMLAKYAHSSAQLHTICLRNWSQLTNAAILLFVSACPALQHVDVSYSHGLTKALLYDMLHIQQERINHKPIRVYLWHCTDLLQELEQNSKFWRGQKQFLTFSAQLPEAEPGLSYIHRGYQFDFE